MLSDFVFNLREHIKIMPKGKAGEKDTNDRKVVLWHSDNNQLTVEFHNDLFRVFKLDGPDISVSQLLSDVHKVIFDGRTPALQRRKKTHYAVTLDPGKENLTGQNIIKTVKGYTQTVVKYVEIYKEIVLERHEKRQEAENEKRPLKFADLMTPVARDNLLTRFFKSHVLKLGKA